MNLAPNISRVQCPTLLGLPILILLLISGCAYESHLVRGDGGGEPGDPGDCTVLFTPEIRVWSDFDGLVLPDVGISTAASAAALAILTREYQARSTRQLRPVPQSSANQQLLNEYLALATLVIDQALLLSANSEPQWWHKHGRTDLGIGPGLESLVSGSGCGAGMLLSGFQVPQSGARALPGVPPDRAVLTLGMFDLQSGQIIQVRQVVLGTGQDLWQDRNLQLAIEAVLSGLPL